LARLDGKHVLFVVPDRFREAEHRIPRRILEDLGVRVTVASWSLDPLLGTHGVNLQPELELGSVCADDYDAFVFVGGDGVRPTDAEVQRIVQEAVVKDKVLAAICASQAILSYAGLVETGGVPTGTVERDGLIITAAGSSSSREFGETIAAAMGE
jgi:putative intracellular protease/amidase